jgi:monofunctional glycosyltransferase
MRNPRVRVDRSSDRQEHPGIPLSQPETGSPAPQSSQPSTPLKAAWGWVRSHKFKTFLLLIAAFVVYVVISIPYFGVFALGSENPRETALMRQRIAEAEDNGKLLKITQTWIPIGRIPKHVLDCIIVAEDGSFYEHGGIDWFEVQESLEKNLEEGRAARGASTITQQLAKNLFLSTSKDPLRKLREVIITLLMERTLEKRRILELYVNLIEWGPGVFGIEAASRTYFGKSASQLSLDEASRLAAVIPSPLRHRPDTDSRYVLRRKAIVLGRLTARRQVPVLEQEEGTAAPNEQLPQRRDTGATPAPQAEPSAPPARLEESPAPPDTNGTGQGT